jgi:hypothetical protein
MFHEQQSIIWNFLLAFELVILVDFPPAPEYSREFANSLTMAIFSPGDNFRAHTGVAIIRFPSYAHIAPMVFSLSFGWRQPEAPSVLGARILPKRYFATRRENIHTHTSECGNQTHKRVA